MPARRNRRVLCFVDECGTAGEDRFAFGCVVVLAREAGRADKVFSDLLEKTANEIHASELSPEYLQGLVSRLAASRRRPKSLLMLNRQALERAVEAPELYGRALVETVKTGLTMFGNRQGMKKVTNVHVIVDAGDHSSHPEFRRIVGEAMTEDGRFKGVEHVAAIDSAAARLLQLADVIAYARILVDRKAVSAAELQRLGIHLR